MNAANLNRIPLATYRLQLSESLDFEAVRGLLDYLQELGISDIYLSPLFRSRVNSSHGYDVVSHKDIEPTFAESMSFEQLADEVRARGMGILLDLVPNHMGINDPGNEWWLDVLENGPLSQFAGYFDIDWNRPAESLRDKVLLPFLDDYFGTVLERGDFKIVYAAGKLCLEFRSMRYPLAPATWPLVLNALVEKMDDAEPAKTELQSIIFELEHLPISKSNGAGEMRDRRREQQVASRRLTQLVSESAAVRTALKTVLQQLNGDPADRQSFDQLEELLNAQWYRFAYWRVASDEINYRRFFDVNDLAAICVEIPDVFAAVHSLVQELLCADRITGLRIDHPDGLYDPQTYLEQLQRMYHNCATDRQSSAASQQLYVVVEKILAGTEELDRQWPTAGTTGYELMNAIGRTLVDPAGLSSILETYERFVGEHLSPAQVIYESKRQTLHEAMSSELTMLSSRLYRIAQQSRMSRDFTFTSLLRALCEVIACFPVYRTYVRSQGWDVGAEDQRRIAHAIRMAKLRNPTMARALCDFIASVLLLEFPSQLERKHREEWREFALRIQQVTSPVNAKGVEDTAFYRYFPLLSLNEVGGELAATTFSVAEFHRLMQRRCADWPHALSATATHDTKRGEDTRVRLHALSLISEDWSDFCDEWEAHLQGILREVNGQEVPGAGETYYLLQTIVGTWPTGGTSSSEYPQYQERIAQHMQKALREAKQNTSWANPAPEYEQAISDFLADLFDTDKSGELLHKVDSFVKLVSDAGYVHSLSQLVLKTCVPGVPDFYQGTELWDFSLVDPDNRRPVDFDSRRQLFNALRVEFLADARSSIETLNMSWPDPRIKMFFTWRLLQARKQFTDVFNLGDYQPLEVQGEHQEKVIAFARHYDNAWIIVIVPQSISVSDAGDRQHDAQVSIMEWGDTLVLLPPEAGPAYEDVFTDKPYWSHSLQQGQDLEMGSLEADILLRSGELEAGDLKDNNVQSAATLTELRLAHPAAHTYLNVSEVLQTWPVAVLVSTTEAFAGAVGSNQTG